MVLVIPYVNSQTRREWHIFLFVNKQETLDTPNVEILWDSSYKGMKISEILLRVPDSEIDGLVS